ncbi:MAG: ATP-binding protein [Pseudomonadota bacterium]
MSGTFPITMLKNPFRLSLRTQLLTVMLAMMVLSVGSLAYLQKVAEDKVFNLIQEEIVDLTKAIEISMEQITTAGSTDKARLKSYIDQVQKRGIKEVSILSDQQEVILSSNPQMVGSRISVSKNEFLIMAKIGADESATPQKIYSTFVPVISMGKLEGYIHISMYFDDLEKLSRDMLYRRVAWTLLVFGIGVLLCILIAYRYTKPIGTLVEAIRSISEGRVPRLPTIPQADISGLADSLGDMVTKLEAQKTMEEKLKRAEQQAMLAQLASGIAHEIRNPLNFISLSVDHLATLKYMGATDESGGPEDLIRKTKAEIRRVNQMVTNFLDLGRELVLHPICLRADLPVEEALGLNRHLIRDRGIAIERDYCDPVPAVEIDIDRMKSCFQNLITNAADAMPNGGMLRISIRENAEFVELTFEDTGGGIQPDDLPKICEPYFTTKKTGTGLGLAISKRVVEAHGGSISIASTPGRGTCIRVAVPHAGRRQ